MKNIREILKHRILVLDGAMGTMIQRYRLTEEDFRGARFKDHPCPLKGNNDLLSITKPEVIKEIHAQYFEAGADIVETNSFGSTAVAQDDYQLADAVYDINFAAAKIAREVADEFTAKNPDKPRFVAGSIGPTTKLSSMSPDVNDPGFRNITFQELVDAFKTQAEGLIDGGSDLLLVETITDTLNAKAALFAIDEVQQAKGTDLPIMISGTITDASGRILSGQNTEAFIVAVEHANPLSIGLNCALGAEALRPYLKIIHDKGNCLVSAHPNAGLPNEMGQYDETPEFMAQQIKVFLDEGLVNIVGGCCGTTPEHIKAIAELAAQYSPKGSLA
ncbi:MAG: homocysteine S-methyltransferase family protein [Flavobacteriales bacterium]|nr:homocysteine S-methyltransferase family protein [Flavobacteriales bacterium]